MSGSWRYYRVVGIFSDGNCVVINGGMTWDAAIRARKAHHETGRFQRVLVELEEPGEIVV